MNAIEYLLGDLDPETADEDDVLMAQDYLMWCITETDTDIETDPFVAEWQDLFFPETDIVTLSLPDEIGGAWIPVLDGDPRARALFERHYSAKRSLARRHRRKTKLFVGPGEKLVLLSPTADALFVWRREKFVNGGVNRGVCCAVFRNEGPHLSSWLIKEAERYAMCEWPYATRFFTYVDPGEVKSRNPGYTFMKAGWRKLGHTTSRGLLMFEKRIVPTVYHKFAGDPAYV